MVHTDHCAKKLLPWVDGLLVEGEAYYKAYGSRFLAATCWIFGAAAAGESSRLANVTWTA